MKLTGMQRRLLTALLDKYEGSATYRGENKVSQSFSVRPDNIYLGYYSDMADVSEVSEFENQMRVLEDEGFISIRYRKNGEIDRIDAEVGVWERLRKAVGRRDKNEIVADDIAFYRGLQPQCELSRKLVDEELLRLEGGKKSGYTREDAVNIVRLLDFIKSNTNFLLERELSITVLGDSKSFEKNYRSRVCKILLQDESVSEATKYIEGKSQLEHAVLEEYNIYANPSYVYFRGPAEITFESGERMLGGSAVSMAVSSDAIRGIEIVKVGAEKVMTIENLTSFNRMPAAKDTLYIYLGGYHNNAKQQLIRKVAADNPGITWLHFGDTDPDGYLILENLKTRTGLNIKPVGMGRDMLIKYVDYTKPVTEGDTTKAKHLIENGKYTDDMKYILETGRKLEQEIITVGLSQRLANNLR